MTGDSLAETTAEDRGQATQTPEEGASAPEESSSADAGRTATADAPAARADSNGSSAPAPEPEAVTDVAEPAATSGSDAAPAATSGSNAEPAAEAPAAAESAGATEPVAQPAAAAESVSEESAPAAGSPAIAPDTEKPAVGPKILGIAEPVKPLPTVKKAAAPARKRRRRPSAAERHRRAFFSALTDLRRGAPKADRSAAEQPQAAETGEAKPADGSAVTPDPGVATSAQSTEASAVEAPAADAPQVEAPAAEAPAAEAPAAEAPAAEAPAAEGLTTEAAQGDAQAASEPLDRSPSTPARVTAAIERVGGPEVIKEALKPKQDEKGQPLKWAAVCAQSAEGLKPGDPVFNAWVRLAATPVREVKSQLPRPVEQERGGRPGEGGRRSGGQRSGERGGRPRRDDRPSRAELASHAQDGTLRKGIRIITGHDEDQERSERERIRKEQREAKRRAERERLARLGY